ncbi:hypothetical protein AB1N83_010637 [Pleurotus pulmonarius]
MVEQTRVLTEAWGSGVLSERYYDQSSTQYPVPIPCHGDGRKCQRRTEDARSPQGTPGAPGTIGATGSVCGWEAARGMDVVVALWSSWKTPIE